MLFLALKKIQIVKITLHQVPTHLIPKIIPQQIFPFFSLPLQLFGKPCHMWSHHPFTENNKAAKRAVRVEIGGKGRGGIRQNFKKMGR